MWKGLLTVVDDVIGEVVDALDIGVPGFVVDVEVSEKGHAAIGLHESSTAMGLQTLSDNTVLNCDIRDTAVY